MKKILFLILIILQGCTGKDFKGGELLFYDSDPSMGFHYPYFLFIPDNTTPGTPIYMMVEPNNSGFASDDLAEHIAKALRIATRDFYLGNYVARELRVPLLVPVFPRPLKEWKIYSHSLDRDVMLQQGSSLERIDLQLIAMFDHAQEKLREKGYEIQDQFLLTGFSASATFSNRFTAIHPGKVLALAAGGLNSLLYLPMDSIGDTPLPYPIGAQDFQILFNKDFQKESFMETPQFYFMGELDDNDAILYDDGYDEDEREIIFKILGRKMQPDRWKNSIMYNKINNVALSTRIYEELGHEHPELVKADIVSFFQSVLRDNN
jgi:hypothetical protein